MSERAEQQAATIKALEAQLARSRDAEERWGQHASESQQRLAEAHDQQLLRLTEAHEQQTAATRTELEGLRSELDVRQQRVGPSAAEEPGEEGAEGLLRHSVLFREVHCK